MIGLTPRQRELLAYLRERETCPSYEEMRRALGCASRRGVFDLLAGLEERGYITRLRKRGSGYTISRSIKVVPQPARLQVIFGPDHWEARAEQKRRAA